MKLGVLCSGNLGLYLLKQLVSRYTISFVFTDFGSKGIIDYCESQELPVFVGNPRKIDTKEFLSTTSCDVLLSVNYLFIIEEELINFPKKCAINVHGSLLPKYRGRTPHVWAIINNEKITGITAHLIDSGCDTGDIVEQIQVDISLEDTGASILNKFNELYLSAITSVLSKIEKDQLAPKPQDHSKATYFGKRTPEDGIINWNWHKERIFNWVRAQAHPYPGAFTYANGRKLTIDSISFTEDGFDYTIANGTVISTYPIKVKTPNGVVMINSHRETFDDLVPTKTILE